MDQAEAILKGLAEEDYFNLARTRAGERRLTVDSHLYLTEEEFAWLEAKFREWWPQ
jgi:hypothetical protein